MNSWLHFGGSSRRPRRSSSYVLSRSFNALPYGLVGALSCPSVRRSAVGIAALLIVASACSSGSKSKTAESTIAPYQSLATTTIVTTPTQRTIPVPEGAPPLPLYSGDPVEMTKADMKFACWWNQHPDSAIAASPLTMEPGTAYFDSLFAEAKRVQVNGLVQEDCTEVLTVVSSPEAESTQVAAVMTTRRPETFERSPSGSRRPLKAWNHRKTLVRWRQQSDGRWLVFDARLLEDS